MTKADVIFVKRINGVQWGRRENEWMKQRIGKISIISLSLPQYLFWWHSFIQIAFRGAKYCECDT